MQLSGRPAGLLGMSSRTVLTFSATTALRDWWTPEDAEAFKTRATNLGAQNVRFKVSLDAPIDPVSPWARTSPI
jgi:hypothetical protein